MVRFRRFILHFWLLVFLTGCAGLPAKSRVQTLCSLPVDLTSHYQYERLKLEGLPDSVEARSGYQIRRLRLVHPGDPQFKPIRIDWYQPEGSGEASSSRSHQPEGSGEAGKNPAVLISPILAGNDLYVREFAAFYAARGLHAVIVYRPQEVFSADRDLQDIEKHFQESIIGLRRAIDWLEEQPSIDARRIGSFSISLGAILTSVLAAVEPRVKAHVLGLPAGRIARIIMTSQDKAIRKRRRAYLERQGWTKEEALTRLESVIVSEPIRFAPGVDPERVLMIVGLFDRVLGLNRSLDLWQAMGRPRLILLPTGHYSAYLATPYLKIVTYSFLRRQLRPR